MISVLYNDTYVFSLPVSIEFLRMSISISLDKNSHMRHDGQYPSFGGCMEHARSNGWAENAVSEEHNGEAAEEVALEYLALV